MTTPNWMVVKDGRSWWAWVFSPADFRCEVVDGPFRSSRLAEQFAAASRRRLEHEGQA